MSHTKIKHLLSVEPLVKGRSFGKLQWHDEFVINVTMATKQNGILSMTFIKKSHKSHARSTRLYCLASPIGR